MAEQNDENPEYQPSENGSTEEVKLLTEKQEEPKKENGVLDSIGDSFSSVTKSIGGLWDGVVGNVPKSNVAFFQEELGELINKNGERKGVETAFAESSYVGYYFGALKATECDKYQQKLIQTYENIKAKSKKLEMVYISCDKTEEHFKENFNTFPSDWWTLDFTDWKRKIGLVKKYDSKTVPHFVLFSPSGEILTTDKTWPAVDKLGDSFPWSGESSSCVIF